MSDHAIVIKADARAFGAVTALDTRVSKRWQSSNPSKRTFDGKPFTGTSECISYRNGRATLFTRARKPNREPKRYTAEWADKENRRRSTVTAAMLTPIGDSNH